MLGDHFYKTISDETVEGLDAKINEEGKNGYDISGDMIPIDGDYGGTPRKFYQRLVKRNQTFLSEEK